MVTHDPRAAAYADQVLFLGDGRLIRELPEPTADRILDTIRELGDRLDRFHEGGGWPCGASL